MTSGKGTIDEDALNIFTDGSSFPHKQRAAGVGVRYVWVNSKGDEEIEDYAPAGWQKATIDEMELKACSIALREAHRLFNINDFSKILLFSDSRYVVDNFFKGMNVRWLGSNGLPVANIELWKELRKEVNSCSLQIKVEWVKAHKSNVHNKAADKLAKQSAQSPVNKPLSISETTKKWSNRKTIRGSVPNIGQVIAIRIVSRKFISKAKTTEYRYEVVDPSSANFKDVDFATCKKPLSRNHCYEVRFSEVGDNPFFAEVLQELDAADYKY